jgi:hypothetical protein
MKLRIRKQQDFIAGLFFIACGLGTVWLSADYKIGSAAKMGPGYFPLVLGGLLAALGLVILIQGLSGLDQESRTAPVSFRVLVLVLGAIPLFGFMVPHTGFVIAAFVLVVVSSLAWHELRWKQITLSAMILAVLSAAAFGYGLKLQIPLWPEIFSWN